MTLSLTFNQTIDLPNVNKNEWHNDIYQRQQTTLYSLSQYLELSIKINLFLSYFSKKCSMRILYVFFPLKYKLLFTS